MTLTVITPATATGLLTLEELKAKLRITGDSENAYFEDQILEQTAVIEAYVGRPLRSETVEETFRLYHEQGSVVLSRWPVQSLTTIAFDEATWVSTDYELDRSTGILRRLSSYSNVNFAIGFLRVRYVSEFSAVPQNVKRACALLIRQAYESIDRDVGVKSERLEGVASVAYFDQTESGLPPEVERLLAPFKGPV